MGKKWFNRGIKVPMIAGASGLLIFWIEPFLRGLLGEIYENYIIAMIIIFGFGWIFGFIFDSI